MCTSVMAAGHDVQPPSSAGERDNVRSPSARDRAQKQCILIVEDNPGDVFIMQQALREHNVQCDTTVLSDGDQAASFFDRVDGNTAAVCPSIVLLDLNLPRRSGHWVLRRIRASRNCPLVPVVIVTSSEAPTDMEQNRQFWGDSIFQKTEQPGRVSEIGRIGE